MSRIIRCCVCARQLVSYETSKEIHVVSGKDAIFMNFGEFCCHECAIDLDDNGLFPEEAFRL